MTMRISFLSGRKVVDIFQGIPSRRWTKLESNMNTLVKLKMILIGAIPFLVKMILSYYQI